MQSSPESAQRNDASAAAHPLHAPAAVQLPRPTAWPIVLALGLTLAFASLVTTIGVGLLGISIVLIAAVGWFRNVLPHEAHEEYAVAEQAVEAAPWQQHSAPVHLDKTHRAQLPLQSFSFLSGIKGGIAGGIAMIIPAELYGIVRFHSIWYVVNLLGGAGVAGWTNPTLEQMTHFRLSAFITANIIQGATTLLVGLLYGALLPVWPKRPILLGGLLAPVMWTGLLHSVLGIVNPFLQQRIDWWSFAASQVFFGVVAGYTVTRLGHLRELAQVPIAVRLGVASPALERRQEHEA